jgi:hypothetical protein
MVALVTGAVVLAAVLTVNLLSSGEHGNAPGPPAASGTQTAGPAAAGKALVTNVGDVRIRTAALVDEFCPPANFPGTCEKPTSEKFLVLTLEGWAGGLLTLDVTEQSRQSFVRHDGAQYRPATVADEYRGVVRIVYDAVPASLTGEDVTLVWPTGQELTVRVTD